MNKLIYVLMGIIILLSAVACRQNTRQGKNYNHETGVDQQGLSFIAAAIAGGNTEIKASGLALTNSSNQHIIGFAKMMIEDHTHAGDELKTLASSKSVTLTDTISKLHEQLIGNISTKKGGAFDKAYIQMMVNDHEQAVKLFKSATTNDSEDIQQFAKKTLPTLQMHLDSANKICVVLK